MRVSRVLAVAALVLLCSLSVLAQNKDPKIIIRGTQGGGASRIPGRCPVEECTPVGTDFTFSIPQKGPLFFNNASGLDWISLTLTESGVPAESVTCVQSLFLSCIVVTNDDESVSIILSQNPGLNPRRGIPAGSNFVIGFACVQGNCWPRGLSFSAHAGTAD